MVVSKIFIYAIMVIFLFPINFITPHDEFYKILNGVSVQFHFDPVDPNNDWDDIIIWMGSESTSIPLYYKNWESTYFPYSLNPSSCKTQIQADLSLWSNSVFGFTETQNITQGINISFSSNPGTFSDPYNSAGVTQMAVEYYGWLGYKHIYKVQTNFPVNQGITNSEVAFNNTAAFKSQYTWVNYTEDLEWNQVCFKLIALHELGHVIGMAHCDYDDAIMYYSTRAGTDFFNPVQHDLDGFNILTTAIQNAATIVEINPITRCFNNKHFFFEYTPEILLYSQKQTGNEKNKTDNSEQKILNSERKLFTIPKNNKQEGVKK